MDLVTKTACPRTSRGGQWTCQDCSVLGVLEPGSLVEPRSRGVSWEKRKRVAGWGPLRAPCIAPLHQLYFNMHIYFTQLCLIYYFLVYMRSFHLWHLIRDLNLVLCSACDIYSCAYISAVKVRGSWKKMILKGMSMEVHSPPSGILCVSYKVKVVFSEWSWLRCHCVNIGPRNTSGLSGSCGEGAINQESAKRRFTDQSCHKGIIHYLSADFWR